jgi:hypothetical protein
MDLKDVAGPKKEQKQEKERKVENGVFNKSLGYSE